MIRGPQDVSICNDFGFGGEMPPEILCRKRKWKFAQKTVNGYDQRGDREIARRSSSEDWFLKKSLDDNGKKPAENERFKIQTWDGEQWRWSEVPELIIGRYGPSLDWFWPEESLFSENMRLVGTAYGDAYAFAVYEFMGRILRILDILSMSPDMI